MCFSKAPKQPDPLPIPQAAPPPTILPSEVSAQAAGEAQRKRTEQLRYGFASTIKTGGRGIIGTGAELAPQGQGKLKLG